MSERRGRWAKAVRRGVLAATAAAGLWGGSTALALPDFTWSGQGPSTNPLWSIPANWNGHSAPGGLVSKLTFPRLGGGCSPTSSPKACYSANNDLTGVSTQAISIDDVEGYSLSGNAISLGAGGLTAAPGTSRCPCAPTALALPIVLSAGQTWTISGGALQAAFMEVFGAVTGASHSLHIILKSGSIMNAINIEVGPLSITSPPSPNFFANGVVLPPNQVTRLNGNDTKPVRISGLPLASTRGVVGPLTVANALLWSGGFLPSGSLTVHGSVSLDSHSEVLVYVTHAGSTPGKDYWQLRATGKVALGGSHLVLGTSTKKGFGPNQPCPKVSRGNVETLISTKGLLQGRFHGIRNGSKVPITCAGHPNPLVKIHYTAHSVTATVQ